MKKTACMLTVFCLLLWHPLAAQRKDLSVLNDIALQLYQQQAASVKPVVLLHTDRQVYAAGQTLWFSILLIQAENRQPYLQEKDLFISLTNDSGTIIKTVRLFIAGPASPGSIAVPADLPDGAYWLTAYTKGMAGATTYLAASLPVLIRKEFSGHAAIRIPSAPSPGRLNCTFTHHIEGNNLISGVSNRVVFSCFNETGRPVAVSGRITNLVDTQVIRFQTNRSGYGMAWIPAVRNRKYLATVSINGKDYTDTIQPSPAIAWQVSITARNKEQIKVRIALSDSLYKTKPASFLIMRAAGKIHYAANGTGMYEAEIPLKGVPDGMATIELFNEKREPVSYRRIWLNEDSISLQVKPNMTYWAEREPVKLDMQFSSQSGLPAISQFSVSVTDLAFTLPESQPADLLLQTVLNTWWTNRKLNASTVEELRRNPEWLDMLMIASPVSGNSPYMMTDPAADQVNGWVRNSKGDPVPGKTVTLFSSQGAGFVRTTITDSMGRFSFPVPRFIGTARLNFQISENGIPVKDLSIATEKQHATPPPAVYSFIEPDSLYWIHAAEQFTAGTLAPFYADSRTTVLPAAEVNYRKTDFSDLIARKRVHKGSWIATPEFIDQAGEGSLANVVLAAPGVSLMGGFLTIQGGMRGISGAVTAKSEPLVVVNGIQMNLGSDQGQLGMNLNISPVMNFLNTFSNRNVEFIEVLTGSQAAQYGTVGAAGVILINTGASVRTGINEKNEARDLPQLLWEGYHIPEQFRSPDYSEKAKKGEQYTDRRITLYWNGDMRTDSSGKSQVRFFTSDHSGPFLVTVQGVTATGALFRKEIILNRRKD